MSIFKGISNVARKAPSAYFGVSSIARKIGNGFLGVSSVARKFFSSLAGNLTLTSSYKSVKSAFKGSVTFGTSSWIMYGDGGNSSTDESGPTGYTYIQVNGTSLAGTTVVVTFKCTKLTGDDVPSFTVYARNSSGTSLGNVYKYNMAYNTQYTLTLECPENTAYVELTAMYSACDVQTDDDITVSSFKVNGEQIIGAI